jgi:hypothetical protein
MEGKVAVVNKQHHVSKGLENGDLLQSGKINDIFKNLRVFTTVEGGEKVEAEKNFSFTVYFYNLHDIVLASFA